MLHLIGKKFMGTPIAQWLVVGRVDQLYYGDMGTD